MYRQNPNNRYTLIVADEVVAKAAINGDMDVRLINSSIEVAEERWIAPALGNKLYEELLDMKNVTVTNANKAQLLADINNALADEGKPAIADIKVGDIYNAIELVQDSDFKKLWNRFLCKIVAEAVDVAMTVPSWLRSTAAGQQLNSPNNIGNSGQVASGSRRDVEFKMDKMIQDRVNPLLERMHQWICDNIDLFPSYCKPCKCNEDGINIQGKSGFIFGVYDDEEEVTLTTKSSGSTPQVKTGGSFYRVQFETIPGQTKYPYPGQVDEDTVKDQLRGATLESFSLEGIELFIGDNPGEMQAFNSVTGIVEWNEASEAPLRAILKYKK